MPAMSQAGALMVTDDYLNNDSNTVIGVGVSGATASSDAELDKACSATRPTHVIDFTPMSLAITTTTLLTGLTASLRLTPSSFFLIGAYENDAVSEAEHFSEQCRVDSCPWRARRWPPGHHAPGIGPTRGASVCCPEPTVAQCESG